MLNATPIVQGRLSAPIAWLSTSLNGLAVDESGQIISRAHFLAHVIALAKQLPEQHYVLNLCDNRYLFLVATWAAIYSRQTCLLPPNKNAATQSKLSARYENAYVIYDGRAELNDDVHAVDISTLDWSLVPFEQDVPVVAAEHLALISFTSGSTGESKPNLKTWRALEQSSAINAQHMLPNFDDDFYHLATVPGQHMWGLETSVLLPVFANAVLVDARPMFPKDIEDLMRRMPRPSALISTPLHLRALSLAQDGSARALNIDNVLCATAPLEPVLAATIETQFSASLKEVYGCSEVGSMAVRRTAQSQIWSQFTGLDFSQNDASVTIVSAAYLPSPVALEDRLEMLDDNEFKLIGRVSDQIKIAGKRGSLDEANRVLNRFDGLLDGVVIFPEQDRLVPRLVAIVAFDKGFDQTQRRAQLRDHFREFLDAAFVPRPIYVVESLPREENGKLAKETLAELYKSLASR